MISRFVLSLCALFMVSASLAADHKDVVVLKSYRNFDDTIKALDEAIEEKGLTIFARIDHQAAARHAGRSIGPSKLTIFGNPAKGAPLMERNILAGLDLPLRILVSEDRGLVQVTFQEPQSLVRRWHLGEEIAYHMTEVEKAVNFIAYTAANRLRDLKN